MTRKYIKVFETLQREILSGKFAHGKRLPSEAELCLRFKISRPTAARALRELQQMGVITRRAGSGNYLVFPSAQQVSTSHYLGLFVPGLGNTEILDPICNEITRYAQTLGSAVYWGDATGPIQRGEDALHLCEDLIARGVEGVFFAPLECIPRREVWNSRIADAFTRHNIPFVLLDRDIGEFPSRSKFDLIGIDNVTAAIEITQHLLDQERRRICFVARENYPSTTDLRLLGCREALRRNGIKGRHRLAFFGDPSNPAFIRDLLAKAQPDAVLCANDQVAAILMRTLIQLKHTIPAQIAVAGFDDVQYATLLSPSLTTIRQPCRELGRSAVKALMERIEKPNLAPRQILHSHSLVVRQSTLAHTDTPPTED